MRWLIPPKIQCSLAYSANDVQLEFRDTTYLLLVMLFYAYNNHLRVRIGIVVSLVNTLNFPNASRSTLQQKKWMAAI